MHSFVDVCCTVTLTLAGYESFYVYHNGGVVLSVEQLSVAAHSVDLDNACVLAIETVDVDALAGVLASTSTGVVTDASWKCSDVEQTGWHLAGFDDAAWSHATVVTPNNGSISEINSEAEWIWSEYDNGHIAYCRKLLC